MCHVGQGEFQAKKQQSNGIKLFTQKQLKVLNIK